jgi:hypothetical protein
VVRNVALLFFVLSMLNHMWFRWRNSVGLGLFIVVSNPFGSGEIMVLIGSCGKQAKDCIQLLHLWLAKRELESRRVKNWDFEGVDIRELDLIPSFQRDAGP